MNEHKRSASLKILIIIAAIAIAISAAVMASAAGQRRDEKKVDRGDEGEAVAAEQWEYLVVAGANSNLTPSGNPNMRKEPGGSFGREAFVLEQQMDKLGAKGWELVSVSGHPSDPIYYFKRRK